MLFSGQVVSPKRNAVWAEREVRLLTSQSRAPSVVMETFAMRTDVDFPDFLLVGITFALTAFIWNRHPTALMLQHAKKTRSVTLRNHSKLKASPTTQGAGHWRIVKFTRCAGVVALVISVIRGAVPMTTCGHCTSTSRWRTPPDICGLLFRITNKHSYYM